MFTSLHVVQKSGEINNSRLSDLKKVLGSKRPAVAGVTQKINIMNYPSNQFETLKEAVNIIVKQYGPEVVKSMNPSNLHYVIYQQFSEGQAHNAIYVNDSGIVKMMWQIEKEGLTGFKKLVDINKPFELYPDRCNDNHVITAVKKVVKDLLN